MLSQNKFIKNLVKLSSSTIIAQVLLIASSPLLTRLYSPDDFGIFALFIAIIGVLSTITNLRYEQAIIIPKKDNSANQLVYLSLIINITFSFSVLLLLSLFSEPIFTFFNIEALIGFYWLIPIGVLFIGGYQALNYWLIRNQEFNIVAKIKIQQSIAMIAIQLTAFKLGAISLILGHSTGQLWGVFKNGARFLRNSEIDFKELKIMAVKYSNFPKFSIWSALLNSTGAQLPVLLFTAYYSPAVAGFYMLTQRVIKGPLSIISQAITQIFISDLRQSEKLLKIKLLKINDLLISVSIIPLAVIVVSGEVVFPLVFGPEWAEAGSVAAVLTPWIFSVFICSPVATLVEFKNKQKSFLFFQLTLFLTRVVSIYFGYKFFESYLDTLKLFSFSSAILWLLFLWYIMRLCNINFLEWFEVLIKKIILVLFLFLPLYFFDSNDVYFWIFLTISIAVSAKLIIKKELVNYEN